MKSETGANEITEIVALRSKLYSYSEMQSVQSVSTHSKAKGIKKHISKRMTLDDYLGTLFNRTEVSVVQQGFISKKHTIYTYSQKKKATSAFDDKSYILADGITTLAFGHKDIKSAQV